MFDIVDLVKAAGYIGLFGIIFSESGFFGFFLPGDSLLFTAGFLASQGFLNLWVLMIVTFTAAVLGDSVGYAIGYKAGPKLFKREDSLFFHKNHLERTKAFYEKHGPKTIILARFFPIIRTFAPLLAGVGRMHYQTFLKYNIIGAALWAIGLVWLGYYLGSVIPGIDKYLIPIILFIIVISLLPAVKEVIVSYKKKSPDD